jgi:alkylhydroperoxidase family enzyme
MSIIPLVEPHEAPGAEDLVARLKAGRRGSLLGIYKALLHNPSLAESWFEHLNAVRWKTDLPGRLREILIIRVGHLLNCRYIMKQHVPKLAMADGVTESECDALISDAPGDCFSAPEMAAIGAADALTLSATVPEEVVAGLKAHYTDRQFMEMMVLIGTYNMHARFVNGIDLDLEPD